MKLKLELDLSRADLEAIRTAGRVTGAPLEKVVSTLVSLALNRKFQPEEPRPDPVGAFRN
ncbi:MAG: hypothetical protein HUK20_11085 [Fibrobacter sp.]|nr:hypothetical protein [Fibrobacter sp.]